VLVFLESLYPLEEIPLKELTLKFVTLLALVSAHRMQTLGKLKGCNIKRTDDYLEIFVDEVIKTSGRNKLQPVLRLPYFRERPQLCVASTLDMYLQRTERVRPAGVDSLILTVKKPLHPASSQTISRWIKSVLTRSGINTNIYTGYSIKHAAVSKAYEAGVNIEVIRKTAGWSEKSNVFCRFYNRPIRDSPNVFAEAILKGSVD